MVIYKDDGACPSCQCSPAERAEVAKTGKSSRPKQRSPKKWQAVDVILLIVGVALANYALIRFLHWLDPPRPRIRIEELERMARQNAHTGLSAEEAREEEDKP